MPASDPLPFSKCAPDPLLLGAPELLRELVQRHVQRGELVRVDSLRPDDRSLTEERELHGLIRDATVAIGPMGDLDLEPESSRRERLNTRRLLLDNRAEPVGDAHSDADDARFHHCLLVPVLPAKGGPWSPCEPLR
jgi:hypothetical protein